jgi:hypothetical protein
MFGGGVGGAAGGLPAQPPAEAKAGDGAGRGGLFGDAGKKEAAHVDLAELYGNALKEVGPVAVTGCCIQKLSVGNNALIGGLSMAADCARPNDLGPDTIAVQY